MAAISVEEKRARKIAQLQRNIEAMIMMTDDSNELVLLGTLLISNAMNIFLAKYSKSRTRDVLYRWIDNAIS